MKAKLLNIRTFYYITTIIIALAIGVAGGIVDILQNQAVTTVAAHLGYPLYFFTLLGVFKVLGGVILILPRKFVQLRNLAYMGFLYDFIFASYSHYSVGDPLLKVAIPIILIIILAVSYFLQKRF